MDEKDKKIIEILKEDSSLTTRQIAKKTRIPITTVHKRIKKLKEKKIIKKFTIELDYEKIGKHLGAYMLISADLKTLKEKRKSQPDIVKDLKKIEGIERVDIVAGGTDIVANFRVKNMNELNKVVLSKTQLLDGVIDTQTLIIMD